MASYETRRRSAIHSPRALIAGSIALATSLMATFPGGCAFEHGGLGNAEQGGGGASSTSTTTGTGGSGAATSSSSSSSGAGGAPECTTADDCKDANVCTKNLCANGKCEYPLEDVGTICDPATNKVCDKTGQCSACADDTYCGTPADCDTVACKNGVCEHAPAAPGTVCSTGVCDAGQACVKCLEDAMNTGCMAGQACSNGTKCVKASCKNNLKDSTETGVDCGGPDCDPCPNGETCGATADCMSGLCEGGVCCDQGFCNGPCRACDMKSRLGICTSLPDGSPGGPACGQFLLCTGLGFCGVSFSLPIGALCNNNNQCDTGLCVAGLCRVIPGQWCEEDVMCASNRCVNGVCTACADNNDCATGQCSSGFCKLPGQSVCSNNADCANGKCQSGFCIHNVGEPCASLKDCTTRYCSNNVCTTCTGQNDCPAGTTCNNGYCGLGPPGDNCTQNSHCQSGNCAGTEYNPFKKCQ